VRSRADAVSKLLLLSTAVITVAVACSEEQLVQPRSATPSGRRGDLDPGGTYTIPVPANMAPPLNGGSSLTPTGIMLPAGSFYRMTIQGPGTIAMTDGCFNPPNNVTYDPNGAPWKDGTMMVINGYVGTAVEGWGFAPSGADWVTIRQQSDTVAHELSLGRTPSSGGLSCDLLSGTQTVVVDFVDAPVTASATTVTVAGQSVHFTSTPQNFTPPPTADIAWTFLPDTGGFSPVAACSGALACDYAPPTSGKMQISIAMDVGGVQAFSPHIFVLKCPTNDSILDNPKVREGLLLALKLSHSDTTPTSARREQGGYVYRDSTGQLNYKITTVGGDACNVSYTSPASAIYIFHTHPFSPQDGFFSSAEMLPNTNCAGMPAGSRYDPDSWGGLSPFDWRSSVDKGKPSVVIDRKRLYKSNPNVTDSTKWADSTKRYDWNTKACKWS
jgi:hypothetical protein